MQRKLYLYPALLKELPDLDEQIRMESARLHAAYGGSSPVITGMPGGKGTPSDPCGNTVVNRILPSWERLRSMVARRDEKAAIMTDVEQYLDSLDALELSVIRLRYFSRMSWPDIGAAEYISEATAHRLHESARGKCKHDSF